MTWKAEDFESRLRALATLEKGWDSYEAAAIDPASVETMRVVLVHLAAANVPKPSLFPTPSGGVQAEWSAESIRGEIECVRPGIEAWVCATSEDAICITGNVIDAALIVRLWLAGAVS